MRIIILSFLLLLASCTLPTNNPTDKKTPNNTTPIATEDPIPTENRTITTPTYGTGKIQIEVFADFQCPACIVSNERIMPIFEEYAASGKLMITFRQFPLTMHKNANWDALAALCSAEQGKYMEYKKWLYGLEETKAGKTVTDTDRVNLAKEHGLDEAKFSQCLSTRAYQKQVESDITLGETKWVNGTPTFYLDGIKLDMSIFKDPNWIRSFLEARMK